MTPELWVNLLVGILGGAVGGTASQLIAGYYKRKGDDRQLAASKEQFDQLQQRWREEQEFERRKILADDRRELFIKTAHALQRTREVVGGPHVNLGPGWEVWKDEVTKCTDHMFILETELRILAPELAQYVRHAATARLVRSAPVETGPAECRRTYGELTRTPTRPSIKCSSYPIARTSTSWRSTCSSSTMGQPAGVNRTPLFQSCRSRPGVARNLTLTRSCTTACRPALSPTGT